MLYHNKMCELYVQKVQISFDVSYTVHVFYKSQKSHHPISLKDVCLHLPLSILPSLLQAQSMEKILSKALGKCLESKPQSPLCSRPESVLVLSLCVSVTYQHSREHSQTSKKQSSRLQQSELLHCTNSWKKHLFTLLLQ